METFLIFQNSTVDGFHGVVMAPNQTQAAKLAAAALVGQGYKDVAVEDDTVYFTGWWHKNTGEDKSSRRLYASEASFKELNPSCEPTFNTNYYHISTTEGWVLSIR